MTSVERRNKNGSLKAEEPFRWTINRAVTELKITANKMRGGLRRLGVGPGHDGKFSTKQIFDALNDLTALEREAKQARLESTIDEAKFQRNRRAEQEGRLIDIQALRKWIDDCQVTLASRIRHFPVSEDQKRQLLEDLRNLESPGGRAARHNGRAGRRKP
jgi:hypothetical protein